jgi:nitrogen fixation NifU-like protein
VSAIADLYREVVLDHRRNPRHRARLVAPTVTQRGANLSCGDEVEVDLRLEGDRLAEVGFGGQGCAISQASASMMSELIEGRSREEVERISASFQRMLSGDGEVDEALLGDAATLAGVRQFPGRVKCAMLPWTTLHQALGPAAGAGTSTTE